MAVAAIDAIIANVVFVAEWNRLVACHIHIRDKRASINLISRPNGSSEQQHYDYDADFCQAIRAAVKDLCHASKSKGFRVPLFPGVDSDVGPRPDKSQRNVYSVRSRLNSPIR